MFRFPVVTVLAVVVIYVGAFVWRFDVLSSPVRDDKHGWLGPLIRGDVHSRDIGKAYFYESDDVSSYRAFSLLCKLWLFVQGLG